MDQSKGIESKVHYPNDYQQDLPLQEWLTEEWDNLCDTPHPVFVIYESRENCIVPPNHLLIRNQVLSDGRLLRCDWRAPVTEGDQGSYFVRVEKIGSAAVASRVTAKVEVNLTNFHTGNSIQVIVSSTGFIAYTEFLPGNVIITIHYFPDGHNCVLISAQNSMEETLFEKEVYCGFPCLDDLLSSDRVSKFITRTHSINWKSPQTFGL